jgi:rare lipoprotein A
MLALTLLAGCDTRGSARNENTALGPRIVQLGQPVPKGGGRYKVGEPYRVNGRVYVPREHEAYDQTGLASWYGELFHGRRTANGEIYDMEALTAAHPTLPIPSYARVTNLYNGRSVVVRVNDRGPYAHGRLIDLSWATASLLNIERPGVAKVRVQYLGDAPLDGDDGYERRMLASQPWAGPRVAFAKSPAKAMRNRGPEPMDYSENRGDPAPARNAVASAAAALEPAEAQPALKVAETRPLRPMARRPETRPQRVASAPAIPPTLVAQPAQNTAPTPASPPAPHVQSEVPDYIPFREATPPDLAPEQTQPVRAPASHPRPSPATAHAAKPLAAPPRLAAAAAPKPSAPAKPRAATAAPYLGEKAAAPSYYVEAGIFPERPLAERLAAILKDIAPASIEAVTHQGRPAHRIRLGPFPEGDAATAAAARIRAAGLTAARREGGT